MVRAWGAGFLTHPAGLPCVAIGRKENMPSDPGSEIVPSREPLARGKVLEAGVIPYLLFP